MKILSTYDFGFKKYLADNKNKTGYVKTSDKEEAKTFHDEVQALEVKITLLNKEEFFIESLIN